MALYQDIAPWYAQQVDISEVRVPLKRQPLLQVPYEQRTPTWAYHPLLTEGDGRMLYLLAQQPQRQVTIKGSLRPQGGLASGYHPGYVSVSVNGASYHIQVGATVSLPQSVADALLASGLDVEVT